MEKMDEYIKKQAAMDAVDARINELMKHPQFRRKHAGRDLYGVKRNISELRPDDVQKVRHGRWLHIEEDISPDEMKGWMPWYCSECGYGVGKHYTPYCPGCGALMMGEDDHEIENHLWSSLCNVMAYNLKRILRNCDGDEFFIVNEKKFTGEQLLKEIEGVTKDGITFCKKVIKVFIDFHMKFKGEEA